MTTQFYERLSNDLTHLLENPIDYNVAIEVGEEPDNQTYKVHSYILQSRNSYFYKKLNEISFNENHIKVLKMPNISIRIFNIIIKYIYGGIISLENLENSVIFNLLITSNELNLEELIEHIQTHFVNNNASWLRLNFSRIYQTIFQVKNFNIIKDFCNNIVAKYPNTIFESENFQTLPEDTLISIIKRDDLQLEESKIWQYVIQWGKAQNPTLPSNLDEWTNDNFLTLKTTLKQCLSHIRYFSISENLENSVIFNLLITSNELNLEELIEHIQTHFVNNNASWLRLNFSRIYQTIFQVKNFNIIKDFCNNIVAKYPNTIFESENFQTLPEDTLISIIKRDDLQLEESKIWQYVIQWGKAQNPTLPSNLDEWTNDNFLTLKTTLKQCLSHIRYFSISGKDVFEMISPYQQILEPKLWSDINKKIMTPNKPISSTVLPSRKILNVTLPTRTTLSSNIITDEHTLEISSWIDKRESNYTENNPYEFELLVRGSRDGFDVKTIYEFCDKVSNTVVVLKVKDTGEILGGYIPCELNKNKNDCINSQDSFTFSLKNTNLKNSILSRVKNFDYAILNYPQDSRIYFGHTLCLVGNLKTEKNSCCLQNEFSYEKPIRSKEFVDKNYFSDCKIKFNLEEYEVFEVSKKK
ncbi:hypothetical protein Glove_74g200 [Diversispora epigaea]|uniref:BTB domain-containing protein n=1 Tax=Diversispora epigaea TaxID=1348612 RepID=A0A397JJZ5_9GLOM|nr:hypothetical protein Glove_74g200 [Diversispora epigaea]